MKRLIRDEKGQAMVLVLILLIVGGLIAAPLLAHMGTGLIAGGVYEKRAAELYAADAGVEDAIWKIQHGVVKLCPGQPNEPPFNISVNGKDVEVTITLLADNMTYHVESTATGDGSGTKIDAYVATIWGDFSGILDSVITSRGDYTLQGPTIVEPPEGEEHGPVKYYDGDWPKADDLVTWYWPDVKDATSYGSDTIDLNGVDMTLEPLYRDGPLTITTSGDTATLTLNGTLYITGDTFINGQGNKVLYLNLNGNTICVNSTTVGSPYALRIGQKCTITGSGCIIAVGDIEFKPSMNSSPNDYVLVMSIEGKTYMQPNGDFYGTLAGSSEVYIQNGEAHWTDYSQVEGGLNFPMSTEGFRPVNYTIASWEVSQQ